MAAKHSPFLRANTSLTTNCFGFQTKIMPGLKLSLEKECDIENR
jgi:hypothetical protein